MELENSNLKSELSRVSNTGKVSNAMTEELKNEKKRLHEELIKANKEIAELQK